ncbi:MAG: NAD(P)H-dependent glycerol-3-phosphate dehydrogenase [Pseudomonadales bacterium]|nr:NAD(P)H-dependent glycerol-3-phosphate dehydrogenase [Pseudomonadales bacterium]
MTKIAVLGLGNFGTALAKNWVDAGMEVVGWTVEDEVFAAIRDNGENTKYLPGLALPGMRVSMQIEETVTGADIVVFALPSSVVLDVVDQTLPFLESQQILIDLAKGLAPGDQLISEAIETKLAAVNLTNKLCVMMGPTIAPELARGVYTSALVTSEDAEVAASIAETLSTKTLGLAAGTDPRGAELWGAFKNVIALACGVVDGLKEDGRGGDNLKAAIFAAGYREGVQVLPTLGAQQETALSAAGIGDLFVTATSPHGRNREMGERLGKGQTLAEAEQAMVMVSEGVRAARMFKVLCATQGTAAPFVGVVCGLLDEGMSIDDFLAQVMQL